MNHPEDDVLEITDLSPILGLDEDQRRWLSGLAAAADASALTLRLTGRARDEIEPVVSYDEATRSWWSGRFIGELRFEGRTLRILPRFGMPQLHRWLFRISGVRLIASKGRYEASRIWLWELLAKLWESELLTAAKHGLPTVRVDELHVGDTIRGRLDVALTAKAIGQGRRVVASRPRNRRIDTSIGGVIIHALSHLRRALNHHGNERTWLTERGVDIVKELSSHISAKEAAAAAASTRPLRYTPITEGYRRVVELSRAIIRQRPSSSNARGHDDVTGVLIDMAELWELYVFHVLRSQLPDHEVVHLGRNLTATHWLLQSDSANDRLGGLLPDILVLDRRTARTVAVLDAKYKSTVPRKSDRPRGVMREDLYQMTSYLSALATDKDSLTGGLIYPDGGDASAIKALREGNPWRIPGIDARLWFLALQCGDSVNSDHGMAAEQCLGAAVASALKARSMPGRVSIHRI